MPQKHITGSSFRYSRLSATTPLIDDVHFEVVNRKVDRIC
jgi:hypothetical protein